MVVLAAPHPFADFLNQLPDNKQAPVFPVKPLLPNQLHCVSFFAAFIKPSYMCSGAVTPSICKAFLMVMPVASIRSRRAS
jgi:hypothetical protein